MNATTNTIPVTINGKDYTTVVHRNIQRFAPSGTIEELTPALTDRDGTRKLRKDLIAGEISIEHYIDQLAQRQVGLGDLVEELAGAIYSNPDAFPGSYAELVDLQNPLWKD